jgi:hypothetical protein
LKIKLLWAFQMQLEHYELSIRGDEFTVCLQQLDALDDSSKGSVELRVVDGKLLIERQINKKNYAAIELKASGHWPFPLTLKWSNFYRLFEGTCLNCQTSTHP